MIRQWNETTETTKKFLRDITNTLKNAGFVHAGTVSQSALAVKVFTKDETEVSICYWHGSEKWGHGKMIHEVYINKLMYDKVDHGVPTNCEGLTPREYSCYLEFLKEIDKEISKLTRKGRT